MMTVRSKGAEVNPKAEGRDPKTDAFLHRMRKDGNHPENGI
jgi:hypothetical protein